MTKPDFGRYASHPGEISWPGLKAVLIRTYTTVSDADLSLRCAGVAFFSFLSIFPVLGCFVLIYGMVTTRASLQAQLEIVQPFLPGSVYEVLHERLTALLAQPDAGLGIGLMASFALALWSGSRGTNALIGAISSVYLERDNRSFLSAAILSLGLTFGALVFLVLSLFTIAAVPVIFDRLPFADVTERATLWLRWPVLALLVGFAISVLFRVAPHRQSAKWKWITPGSVTTTILWLLLSALFSFYVENFGNYSATFGPLTIGVVMLLWMYYSTLIVLLGASLNAELEHQTKIDTTTGPAAPMGHRGAYVADHLPQPKHGSRV